MMMNGNGIEIYLRQNHCEKIPNIYSVTESISGTSLMRSLMEVYGRYGRIMEQSVTQTKKLTRILEIIINYYLI